MRAWRGRTMKAARATGRRVTCGLCRRPAGQLLGKPDGAVGPDPREGLSDKVAMGLWAQTRERGSHTGGDGNAGPDPREGLSDKVAMGLWAQTRERGSHTGGDGNAGPDPREGLSDKAVMGLWAQTRERGSHTRRRWGCGPRPERGALTQAADFNPARWGLRAALSLRRRTGESFLRREQGDQPEG